MRRTLLIGCLVFSVAACADDAMDLPQPDSELAAVGQSPWVDDPLPGDQPTRDEDPWSDEAAPHGEVDDDPWVDPPRTPSRPTVPAPARPLARSYDFEQDKQGWTQSGRPIANVTRSTAQHASGASALEVTFDGAGTGTVSVVNPPLRPGARVSFQIFVPSGARLNWIQPYLQRGPGENWTWTGAWNPISAFRQNAWTTISLQVPADARTFSALGVQFETAGSFRGRVYIDDVRF